MIRFIGGDCRERLKDLPDQSVQCVVTSPPYFGLRDYGTAEWTGGNSKSCDHARSVWDGPKQTQGAQSSHAAKADRLGRRECIKCGAVRTDHQIGLEPSPAAYVAELVGVFREVRRILRDDGTVWLNLGDSYCGSRCGPQGRLGEMADRSIASQREMRAADGNHHARQGAKPKDLLMIPARVAIALCDDGWYLRSSIIWAKPNPMPESVTDRPTSSHEHVFLLTKSGDSQFWTHRDGGGSRTRPEPDYRWINKKSREEFAERPEGASMIGDKTWRRLNLWSGWDYFYDADAVRESAVGLDPGEMDGGAQRSQDGSNANVGRNYRQPNAPSAIKSPHGQGFTRRAKGNAKTFRGGGAYTLGQSFINDATVDRDSHGNQPNETFSRNLRDVWTIATTPFAEAHFATFPPKLVETCVKAGTSERGACPACGAPWARVLGAKLAAEGRGSGNKERKVATEGERGRMNTHIGSSIPWAPTVSHTAGWQPTCTCPPADPVPCVVLDPFSGAGTTALVADRLGRDAIGIDLNPTYGEMARERLVRDAGLFAEFGS